MILIYVREFRIFLVSVLVTAALFLAGSSEATAQSGVSITVAPTLVELNMEAGEVWRSSIKVVNTNTFPLTVSTIPAHFAPTGERGQGSVVPESEVPNDEELLVNWLTVENTEITILPGQSAQVPFIIETPPDAAPGSHFGALQVSTVPPLSAQQVGLNTSQVISSLLFVRIAGDITEAGDIRSFTATDSWQTEPRTELTVRFENTGNVHVRPVGEIVIRNIWGTERGRIPVNYNTSFGNALPGTIREYQFAWSKEPSLLDIGYYAAEVSLAYGVSARQFATSQTGFWVIPLQPLAVLGVVIFTIIGFIVFVSRWYISQLLAQAGVPSLHSLRQPTVIHHRADRPDGHDLNLSASSNDEPLEHIKPTRPAWYQRSAAYAQETTAAALHVWRLMSQTAKRVTFIGGIVLLFLIVTAILVARNNYDPGYRATVGEASQAVTYNAEEIAFFQQPGMQPALLVDEAAYTIVITNTSKEAGSAGRLAATLVPAFPVTTLDADASETRPRTVIVFPVSLQAEAVALSEQLNGALLSAVDSATSTIRVYVGADTTW